MPNAAENASTPPPQTTTQWALIRRLLGMVWRYRWHCFGVLGLQTMLMVLGLAGLSLVGIGVDYIRYVYGLHAAMGPGAGVPKPPEWPLGIAPPADWSTATVVFSIAGAILLMAALRSVLNYQYSVTAARLVQAKVVVDLRAAVYEKLQRLSFRFFDEHASGSIINRVTGDVQMVRMFVDQVVMQSIIMVVSLLVYLLYMLQIHAGLTLACLATTPLIGVATNWFSRRVRPAYRRNRELMDGLIRSLAENLQGVQVVKGFYRQEEEIGKFAAANRTVREQQNAIFRDVSFYTPLIGFLSNINIAVLLGYGGCLVIRYEQSQDLATALRAGLSIGQFLVFSGLLQQFSGQVNAIASIANSMQQSLTGAERVFEILDAPVGIQTEPAAVKPERIAGEVTFERVRFGYRRDEPVLREVSLHVASGQCVAILGATGSGKSTLLSLIPRFYDPDAGTVRIDGHDARQLDLDLLRRSVGVVFQESFLFSNTVAANIAFGHPEATRAQIEHAARLASADRFIAALPQGYDTILAEGGNSLSGGQRQRLAIARAILLEPSILILDDPTAAIDPGTEEEILVAMEQAMQGRTTFLVTHRLSTLRRADWILVLADGQIVESGTHADLMQRQGEYYAMARIQTPDADRAASAPAAPAQEAS
ncbi:MAG: ABC transporter ATP-binding protein/permease [Lentisphaerae bacterium]|nr:ABC transporter ATP-binding protein/permease [Lentisphaerota bacterium]